MRNNNGSRIVLRCEKDLRLIFTPKFDENDEFIKNIIGREMAERAKSSMVRNFWRIGYGRIFFLYAYARKIKTTNIIAGTPDKGCIARLAKEKIRIGMIQREYSPYMNKNPKNMTIRVKKLARPWGVVTIKDENGKISMLKDSIVIGISVWTIFLKE